MTDSMPPTPEEMWQLSRSLMEKTLDKAASDPQWKQWLLDDPQAAMREADFPEPKRLDEMLQSERGSQEGAEVRGQQRVVDNVDLSGGVLWHPPSPSPPVCGVNTPWYTCYYSW